MIEEDSNIAHRGEEGNVGSPPGNAPHTPIRRSMANRSGIVLLIGVLSFALGYFVGTLSSSKSAVTSSAGRSSNPVDSALSTLGAQSRMPKLDSVNRSIDSLTKEAIKEHAEKMRTSLNLSDEVTRMIVDTYERRRLAFMALVHGHLREVHDFHDQTDSLVLKLLTPEKQSKWRHYLANPHSIQSNAFVKRMGQQVGLSDKQESQIETIMEQALARMQEARKQSDSGAHVDMRPEIANDQSQIMQILTPEQRIKWQEQQKINRHQLTR